MRYSNDPSELKRSLAAARAEIERLTKERDEARAQVAAAYELAAQAKVFMPEEGGFLTRVPLLPETKAAIRALTPDGLIDLIGEFGREVCCMLDDCETSGPVGEEVHTITDESLTKVSAILDRIDALPFEEPGVILGTGAMLQAAIKQTFQTYPPQLSEMIAAVERAFDEIRELCRAYEFVTKGETRRQHVGENGKL